MEQNKNEKFFYFFIFFAHLNECHHLNSSARSKALSGCRDIDAAHKQNEGAMRSLQVGEVWMDRQADR